MSEGLTLHLRQRGRTKERLRQSMNLKRPNRAIKVEHGVFEGMSFCSKLELQSSVWRTWPHDTCMFGCSFMALAF